MADMGDPVDPSSGIDGPYKPYISPSSISAQGPASSYSSLFDSLGRTPAPIGRSTSSTSPLHHERPQTKYDSFAHCASSELELRPDIDFTAKCRPSDYHRSSKRQYSSSGSYGKSTYHEYNEYCECRRCSKITDDLNSRRYNSLFDPLDSEQDRCSNCNSADLRKNYESNSGAFPRQCGNCSCYLREE